VDFAIDGAELRTAHGKLQRRNDRLHLLQNLMKQITSSLDLHEVLRSISANLREVMQGDIVSVSLHDAESGNFKLFVLDFPQGKGIVSEGLLMPLLGPGKRVLETLQPAIAGIEELYELGPEVYAELTSLEGVKSVCLIPLVNRGRVLGILMIARTMEDPFAEEEVEFLSQVAGSIAIAIENALAYEEISQLKDKLAEEKLYLEEEIRSEMGFEQIIGKSPALKHALQMAETVAPSDSTVLLLAVLMAEGNYLFKILPILLFVLERPTVAPGDPDPVEVRLFEQAEHLLEVAIIDVVQHILLFAAELTAPPCPLGFPTFNLAAIQPDETKVPLLRPRGYVLRLGMICARNGLKGSGGVEQ
jgi:hypothetical protein